MGEVITNEAPRGGVNINLGGRMHVMRLTLGDIERWEDKHGGIYTLWEKLTEQNEARPTTRELLDLLALALVGGGQDEKSATEIIKAVQTNQLLDVMLAARVTLAAAFIPDVDQALEEEGTLKKKSPDMMSEDASEARQPQDTDPPKSEH